MLSILLESLLLASGGILSVGSITIVILLLISDRGWRNGLAYMSGYVGGYTLIGISAVLVGSNAVEKESGESGGFFSILLIVLSLFLLWLSQSNWRKSPTENNESPRLFSMIDNISPPRAFAFGAVVTVINFKNLAIFLSALSISLLSDLSLLSKIVIVLLVVLVFCSSVIVPILIYLSFPEAAKDRLNRIKQALETHRRSIGIWVPLVFGLIFLFRGITGLY